MFYDEYEPLDPNKAQVIKKYANLSDPDMINSNTFQLKKIYGTNRVNKDPARMNELALDDVVSTFEDLVREYKDGHPIMAQVIPDFLSFIELLEMTKSPNKSNIENPLSTVQRIGPIKEYIRTQSSKTSPPTSSLPIIQTPPITEDTFVEINPKDFLEDEFNNSGSLVTENKELREWIRCLETKDSLVNGLKVLTRVYFLSRILKLLFAFLRRKR